MNLLKSYIIKEEKSPALNHIDQFSKLLRNFLEFSKEKKIAIQDIIENLQLYVSLENKILNRSVQLNIQIAPKIEPEFDEIPAFQIQPFVENSILHGFANDQIIEPQINIKFYHDLNDLCIDITDNGMDRKASSEKSSLVAHIGIATNLTKKRIKLLNDGMDGLTTEDLYHPDGSPAGTKVSLRIKRFL